MKVLCFALLCTFALGCSANKIVTRNGFTGYSSANINEYVDDIFRHVGLFTINNNLDPLKVIDIDADFDFTFIFDYHGEIHLRHGWLQGLSTVKRSGDCLISYDHELMRLDIVVEVDIIANFLYNGKFVGIGADGELTAKITKQVLIIGILVDFQATTFSLQDFKLDNNGKIDVHVTGLGFLGLGDPIVNALLDAITTLFKGTILSKIGDQLDAVIRNILLNIPPLLPPLPDGQKPPSCNANRLPLKIPQLV